MIKEDTHIVIKRSDIEYLSMKQRDEFILLLNEINKRRLYTGRKLNKYLVCNKDEPYADAVLKVILDGEYAKSIVRDAVRR